MSEYPGDPTTLPVLRQESKIVSEGTEYEVTVSFDGERVFARLGNTMLQGILEMVLSITAGSIPHLEFIRQARPTTGIRERAHVAFGKIRRFELKVVVEA